MSLRVPLSAVLLLAAPASICLLPSGLSAQRRSASPSGGTASAHQSHVLYFYTSSRQDVDAQVHAVPATNAARLAAVRSDFSTAGCAGPDLSRQPVRARHGRSGTNLICSLPAGSHAADPGIIVVAAHYDHHGPGGGALDDWSGAILLPFLYRSLQGQPRTNTYVFLESFGLSGARTWLRSLSTAQRKCIRAMIDLDALGLGPTRFYSTIGAFQNPPPGVAHLQTLLLWAAYSDGIHQAPRRTPPLHWLSTDITEPFRGYDIPTILVHSIPRTSSRIPGSARDLPTVIHGSDYYGSYNLICAFLVSLDHVAADLERDEPFWTKIPTNVQYPLENPTVTFMKRSNGIMQKSGIMLPQH